MTTSDDLATLKRCPEHGIPDCSPLLNGCSWPSDPRCAAAHRVEVEIARLCYENGVFHHGRDQIQKRAEAAEAKNAKLSALIVEQEAEYRKERRVAEAEAARLCGGLRALAKHELGEAFGADSGDCWCDPFYRGEEWPGHDDLCSSTRALLADSAGPRLGSAEQKPEDGAATKEET